MTTLKIWLSLNLVFPLLPSMLNDDHRLWVPTTLITRLTVSAISEPPIRDRYCTCKKLNKVKKQSKKEKTAVE